MVSTFLLSVRKISVFSGANFDTDELCWLNWEDNVHDLRSSQKILPIFPVANTMKSDAPIGVSVDAHYVWLSPTKISILMQELSKFQLIWIEF